MVSSSKMKINNPKSLMNKMRLVNEVSATQEIPCSKNEKYPSEIEYRSGVFIKELLIMLSYMFLCCMSCAVEDGMVCACADSSVVR